MPAHANDPVYFESPESFRAWLAEHAGSASELLVGLHKVRSSRPCMTWSESVDQALCFGWIDGVRRRIDEDSYSIRFTPRKAGSIWSAVNIAKIEVLRAQGLMLAAGEAAFARRSEERSRVYSHERETPAELAPGDARLFQAQPAAWDYFCACPPGYRATVLHWITSAKKEETRSARLARLIEACAAGQRL